MTKPAAKESLTSAELVPEQYPPIRTDTPMPVRSVRGLLALPGMVLLWFMPKRFGASLAAAGWRAALAAHLLGLIVGFGLIFWALELPSWNPFGSSPITMAPGLSPMHVQYPNAQMTFSEYLRAPFAVTTTFLHLRASRPGTVRAAAAFLLSEVVVFFGLAAAMMPFAAAGEIKRILFSRCLRLTWWSTSLLIPFGLGLLARPAICRMFATEDADTTVTHSVIALFIFWWLFVFLRSGLRYAGPAVGPAWEPRTPRCEGCNYIIAQIPVSTNCPECGHPVKSSLPERREPPAFANAATCSQAVKAFDATLRAVIFDRTFFERLAVHRNLARDRIFFLLCAAATVLPPAFIALAMMREHVDTMPCGLIATFLMNASIGFGLLVISTGWLGTSGTFLNRTTQQSEAIAAFYSMTGLLPVSFGVAVLSVGVPLVLLLTEDSGTTIQRGAALVGLACILGIGGYLTFIGLRCFVRAARHAFPRTRRANA